MGVDGAKAETLESCADLLRYAFGQPGPFVIELVI
jgi:acetolactate synthase-1/2/3 large subunit